MPLTVSAPAKLNLFLHIVGRTSNGYHQLQSIFQLVDLHDELSLSLHTQNSIEFSCSDPEIESPDNLVVKAAKALQKHCQLTVGARIHLNKKLPMGGGIGGGSSDAASALLALNHLWQCQLTIDELADIGLSLGADIPVFIRGRSAWAEGVGEQLTPVALPEKWYVIIHPKVHVSTALLFAHPELTRDTAKSTIRTDLAALGHNDFEPLVRKLHPDIDDIFNACLPIAEAKLTGSGSCIFIATDSESAANIVKAKLNQTNPELTTYIAKGLDSSPVHNQLNIQT
ncbi:4-(cytidine 5'-diphospho)-2-C-methyl-D-erythritol kinase [Reinekea marina]|uniref:4-diphosphocytidyl-2-C-methyl-D-erythritol kinase n=1 Tax=Reinekea marina TaxID=1310421 RepID=A0ABV7WVK5_9GAMM|nr:4-(cytidine 5'-diphospho)-2-C-methyl-D-erythritol kinase [Reinekea marina]MDN3648862.1 4-(cytidine 5'-diphospho)-2-C-methyl-D-erythritol kinase [Reinekea marina]